MQLTDPQRRTLDQLIGTGERPVFASDLPQRLRDRIEDAVRGLEGPEPLWLGKETLNDHTRCEGAFEAKISGEAPPFQHSPASASGVLLHKAIELEVGSRDGLDPHALATAASERLIEKEERFADFWRERTALEQDDLLMQTVRGLTLFQGSFPPMRELRRQLAPATEAGMRAELLGGALVLSGKIDLLLGAADRLEPMRGTRLAVDLKTGNAYPNYVEDNRYYALLLTLRFGVPPYRVASLFLEGGTWQAEDIDEELLFHASERVIAAARSAHALRAGRDPALRPGPWCRWCPRAEVCPAADPDADRAA
jgi:PD-(D/E)XK nuclease superfamily protein